MSGKDERKWNYRCPRCKGREPVVLYTDEIAGWIVGDNTTVKLLGFDILLAATFEPEKEIIRVECGACGALNINIQSAAIEVFKRSVREKTCLSWKGYYVLLTQEA